MSNKWTYKVEHVKPAAFANAAKRLEQVNDVLTRRGLEGWELVDVISDPLISWETHFYFKKPF